MEFTIRNGKTRTRATARGDMTIYAAEEAKAALLEAVADGRDLDIDMSGVHALDTAAVQLLLAARRRLQAEGRHLCIVAPSGEVREALALCGLSDMVAARGRRGRAGAGPTEGSE